MKKLLLTILIAGFFSAHTVSGQDRRSGNTNLRSQSGSNSSLRGSSSSLSPVGTTQRQTNIPRISEWRTMNNQEKREVVNNMSTKERSLFLQKMKENIVIDDIDISADKQDEFKALYAEYQTNQKQIKEKFLVENNIANLSIVLA